MDTKLFELSDMQIWKRDDRYFAIYDAGAHQVEMREDEISQEEATSASTGNDAAVSMLRDSLQNRPAICMT